MTETYETNITAILVVAAATAVALAITFGVLVFRTRRNRCKHYKLNV